MRVYILYTCFSVVHDFPTFFSISFDPWEPGPSPCSGQQVRRASLTPWTQPEELRKEKQKEIIRSFAMRRV